MDKEVAEVMRRNWERLTKRVVKEAEGDPKLLAVMKKGYRAALKGDAWLPPNYRDDWKFYSWVIGYGCGRDERRRSLS